MSQRSVVLTCLGILFIALAAWFASRFERVPSRQWVQPSGEARLRDFLAAQRLAERMEFGGVRELRAATRLDALAQADVLLLPNGRQDLDGMRIGQIVGWVEAGGHLIAEAEPMGTADPLLERFAVKRARAAPAVKPLEAQLDGRKLQVQLGAPLKLQIRGKPRLVVSSGKDEIRLASLARGKGAVTAASSLDFARNRYIGEHDHAALFWALLNVTGASELLVFVRPERLSLLRFLGEHALPALVSAAALLALWLWRIGPRFGPVAPDLPPARRRLLDHLRASGRFYWARGLRARLVDAARDAALRRVARAQPDFASAPPAERAARLASLGGLSPAAAARLLASSDEVRADDMRGVEFIRFTQTAQSIHSALEKGKK